jgi:hypothetical protein
MFKFWKSRIQRAARRANRNRASLRVEALESRLVPYSASSNAWPNPQLITISFVPDGMVIDGTGDTSNLFATFNATFGSTAAWQNIILKAAQTWAQQTNVNFAVVADDGAQPGTGMYQQGDPNMGDIRIMGYNFGNTTLAQTFMPPPVNNTDFAGDLQINTSQSFGVGNSSAYYDLYTVAVHELGHALGLYHSAVVSADMYSTYTSAKTGLTGDDIQGIESVYSGGKARSADAYGGANNSFANAVPVTLNGQTSTAQLVNLNLNTASTVEYFQVTLPSDSSGGLTVSAQSSGLSLLDPRLTLYASDKCTVLGTAGSSSYTGGTATVTYTSAAAGQTFYIKVQGYMTGAFATGSYDLSLACGTPTTQGSGGLVGNVVGGVVGTVQTLTGSAPGTIPSLPAVVPPAMQILDGTVGSYGGGQAIKLNPALQIDGGTYTAATNSQASRSVAMDANGNYVVVWTAQGEDGSGWGVFAQRYNATGTAVGSVFQVNTYTAGDQMYPSVAMDPSGAFVVTWSSYGQNSSGWNIHAQLYNADGTTNGGELAVNGYTGGDTTYSSVAMDANGNFVVAWQSYGQDGSGWGIRAKLFNAQGVAQGTAFQVNTTTAGDQTNPSVAMDANGDFVISWQGNQTGSWDVYAQCYSAGGVAQGGEFQVNTTMTGNQTSPAVAMNPATGAFIITWASTQLGNSNIFAQLYSAAGAAQGGEFQVDTATGNTDQLNPGVSMDGNGNFMITWTSYTPNGNSAGVFAQQYTTTGAAVGLQFGVDNLVGSNQQNASVTMDSQGDLVVVWTANTFNGTTGVFGQKYLLTGGSGMVAGSATDSFWSQAAAVLATTTNGNGGVNGSGNGNGNGAGHPHGCACALCVRLARALGISNATVEGSSLTLPPV